MTTIREAHQDDIPDIQSLFQSIPGFWDSGWRGDVLEIALQSSAGLALVAEQEGKIIGFVCAHDVGFRAYLSELAINETVRGQGIGAQLLGALEKALVQRGCAIILSDVWRDAEGFYRHLGWSQPEVILLRKKLY